MKPSEILKAAYHYERCWKCGKKWRCYKIERGHDIPHYCCPCHTENLLKAVANTWCQIAEYCYEIGDIRATGPRGCIHVQARMLLARIGGNQNPKPVYWKDGVLP